MNKKIIKNNKSRFLIYKNISKKKSKLNVYLKKNSVILNYIKFIKLTILRNKIKYYAVKNKKEYLNVLNKPKYKIYLKNLYNFKFLNIWLYNKLFEPKSSLLKNLIKNRSSWNLWKFKEKYINWLVRYLRKKKKKYSLIKKKIKSFKVIYYNCIKPRDQFFNKKPFSGRRRRRRHRHRYNRNHRKLSWKLFRNIIKKKKALKRRSKEILNKIRYFENYKNYLKSKNIRLKLKNKKLPLKSFKNILKKPKSFKKYKRNLKSKGLIFEPKIKKLAWKRLKNTSKSRKGNLKNKHIKPKIKKPIKKRLKNVLKKHKNSLNFKYNAFRLKENKSFSKRFKRYLKKNEISEKRGSNELRPKYKKLQWWRFRKVLKETKAINRQNKNNSSYKKINRKNLKFDNKNFDKNKAESSIKNIRISGTIDDLNKIKLISKYTKSIKINKKFEKTKFNLKFEKSIKKIRENKRFNCRVIKLNNKNFDKNKIESIRSRGDINDLEKLKLIFKYTKSIKINKKFKKLIKINKKFKKSIKINKKFVKRPRHGLLLKKLIKKNKIKSYFTKYEVKSYIENIKKRTNTGAFKKLKFIFKHTKPIKINKRTKKTKNNRKYKNFKFNSNNIKLTKISNKIKKNKSKLKYISNFRNKKKKLKCKHMFKNNLVFIKKLFMTFVTKGLKSRVINMFVKFMNFVNLKIFRRFWAKSLKKFIKVNRKLYLNIYLFQIKRKIFPVFNNLSFSRKGERILLPVVLFSKKNKFKKLSSICCKWLKKSINLRKEKTLFLKIVSEIEAIRKGGANSIHFKNDYYTAFYKNKYFIKFFKKKKWI